MPARLAFAAAAYGWSRAAANMVLDSAKAKIL
jgi:hypothetical protein